MSRPEADAHLQMAAAHVKDALEAQPLYSCAKMIALQHTLNILEDMDDETDATETK